MIAKIVGLLTLIGIVFGAYFFVDNWKANAKDLQTYIVQNNLTIEQMKQTYETDKMESRYQWLDDQIFKLKEKYRNKEMPDDTAEQVHKYEQEYKDVERKLEGK